MGQNTKGQSSVSTVDTAFEIIGIVKDVQGCRLSDVAEELDLAKSTVHRHLKTLEEWGYVCEDGNEYRIGIRFLDLGIHARNRIPGLAKAREKTAELAADTGELCVYAVEEHGRLYLVCREKGAYAVETGTRVGLPLHLHATAAGKCILAHSSAERVREIIDRWGLVEWTERTTTDQEELFEKLERVREQGYAVNREERTNGVYAIAAPVFDDQNRILGSLAVSGPSNRMRERIDDEIADLLLGAVNELELNITYS